MVSNLDATLQQAIDAVQSGQREEAKQLLLEVLRVNPRSEAAWLWMSAAVQTRTERVRCLQQALEINPRNEKVIQALQALGIEVAPPPPPEPEPAPQAPGDVPIPTAEAVERARQEAEAILRAYRAVYEPPEPAINWAVPDAPTDDASTR
ncbi:MAG TPA: hypothetical protein VKY39_07710 [Aggregatilineales bacterium]|nr:hypothetical protein [Aggregatilineales bacterium]